MCAIHRRISAKAGVWSVTRRRIALSRDWMPRWIGIGKTWADLMNILVSEGAGFIGCNLVRYLLRRTSHSVVKVHEQLRSAPVSGKTDPGGHSERVARRADP